MLALFAADDVAFRVVEAYVKEESMEEAMGWSPTLVGQSWTWTETVPCTPEVDADHWSPSPSRQEVVQAPPQSAQKVALPTHLWQPPPDVNLNRDEDDDEK
ncbi:hypothetical protein ZWY2020_058792 [Hordeum vulgare]|nr:hypothetical protein ZWY2020_058792 [Hordeum vulgare]